MSIIDLDYILTHTDPDPAYLVDGLYYQGQIVVVAGEPGVGKSFLQYTLAICLASGLNFLDRPSQPVKVLYIDEENARPDLQQYLRQIWRGLGCPPIAALKENLFIEHFALASQGKDRFKYLANRARAIQPGLIVIDTATPVCDITDENHNGEASKAMRALRHVKECAGPTATMVILKHSLFSHDPASRQTIRGAKAWLGECDAVIYHKLSIGKPRTDGLRNCRLVPDKVRAFGLRHELQIIPQWCGEGDSKGITLIPRA